MNESSDVLTNFWSLNAEDVLAAVSSTGQGLGSAEAATRQKRYGLNLLKSRARTSSAILFLRQFKSPITLLLIAAALLSMALADFSDSIIILFIIFASSLLGFWQEKGAVKAMEELLKLVQIRCRVLRDGAEQELPAESVVPGDVIILSAGDIIPADSLLLESEELFVDEAIFTGETFPVEKSTALSAASEPLAKRKNALFMGSHVISGRAKAVIVKTARQTELGQISGHLQVKAPETDFEKGIRRFGYMLMEITLIFVIIISTFNILLHKPALDAILFSLALAVGLTPQLLPAIISVNLSVGARTMAKKQVIVKHLASIESFGSMNILCSDKTGTVTEGKVTLAEALDVAGNHSDKTLQFAWLNASLQLGFVNPIDEAIRISYHGKLDGYSVLSEVPYDFIRKRLSIQISHGGENFVVTKGALKNIVEVCDKVEMAGGEVIGIKDKLELINQQYKALSLKGFRLLGVAYKELADQTKFDRTGEKNMIFLGFITLFDPPKKDARQTIGELNKLGVQLKLITGDNALVAKSLADQIGLEKPLILTGGQINKMSESALYRKAILTNVFAEIEPNQKERIILALKKSGNVVGFIGDGINDTPALHAADVGISVDTAVDIAKEAADIVLLNRSLNVLVEGITIGRKTFANTMKYIFMATSANFGNMFSMAGASLFLPFLPLLPKQVLLTNLLTDFPEMGIATDRVDNISIEQPHHWDIKFIKNFMIVFGLLSSVFDYLTFGILLFFMKANEYTFQSGWFTESVISATLIVLVVRTRGPFFKSLPGKYLLGASLIVIVFVLFFTAMPFSTMLGFTRLPLIFYGWMMLIVAAYIFCAEVAKSCFIKA